MQRTGQGIHAGTERQVRIAEHRSDQVGGMRRAIASFVVGVNGEEQAHVFLESFVVKAEHVREIPSPIQRNVGQYLFAAVVHPAENVGGHPWQTRYQVHGIFIGSVPVLRFIHARVVALGEYAGVLHSEYAHRKLGHRMRIHGQRVNSAENVLRHIGTAHPILREPFYLFLGRYFAHQHQPEKTFRQRLLAVGRPGQAFPQFRDGISAEANTFFGIEQGRLPEHRSDVAHAAIDLVQHHIVHFFVAVFF